MSLVRTCDLCNRTVQYGFDSTDYKTKRRAWSPYDMRWQRIDAHDECVRKLFGKDKT